MVSGSTQLRDAEVPRQVTGYWFADGETVPVESPAYRATGALLPPKGSHLTDSACLDLMNIDGEWRPLSDAGRYTYSHTSGLLRGDRWFFVIWQSGQRTMYEAQLEESIPPAKIRAEYGDEAYSRSRPDRASVRIRLHRA